MTLMPVPVADREFRRRWGLGPFDPVPISYPKMMFRDIGAVPQTSADETDQNSIGGDDGSNDLAGESGSDQLGTSPPTDRSGEKYLLEDGRYRLNPDYKPPFDISLEQAIAIPPMVGAAAALLPEAAILSLRALDFARKGRELKIGQNFRIAPFGNRTSDPYGKWPHYHRRPPQRQPDGGSPPGQGIGRHRPWQSSEHDKSQMDRF